MSARARALRAAPTGFDRLVYFVDRALRRLSPRLSLASYRVVAQPVAAKDRVPQRRASAVVVREAGRGDPILTQIERPADEIERRFASPGRCFVAEREGRMVGFLWVLFGPYGEPEDRCVVQPVPPGEAAWDLDVYVDPAERLGTTFARLWDGAHRALRARGVSWTLSRIAATNARSMASHARLGSLQIGRLYFLRAGPVQAYAGTLAPFVALTSARSPGPHVAVRAPGRTLDSAGEDR